MTRIAAALCALCVSIGGYTLAQPAPPPAENDRYTEGWCDGYTSSIEQMKRNRMHWRRLLGAQAETSDETLNRIYSKPWTGPLAPRTLSPPPGVPELGPGVIDSADLYLMLPDIPKDAKIHLRNGMIITCTRPQS